MRANWVVTVATVWSMATAANSQVEGQAGPAMPNTQSMFEALRQSEMGTVKAAINKGVDVNSRDANGNTLLMQAAVYATVADLEFLLAHGADVRAANKAGHTALMRAMPDLAKIELLAGHGADINASAGGLTPLLIAAGLPSAEEVVRYLIKTGADLKAVNALGLDAIMIAAGKGAAGTLKILLDAGASGASQRRSMQPLAARPGTVFDQATLDRIRKKVEGVTALMSAARAGCEACIRLLLEHGADAKARTQGGLTALHSAAYNGDLTLVKLLLDAGAPVNAVDDRGLTPLMMASNSRTKNPEVVRLLLNRGADVQLKDTSGRTAGDWARIGGRPEIGKMLPATAAAEIVKATVAEPASRDIHAAVAKSIALLEQAAPGFFHKSGCISCHNVSIPLIALTEGRRRGYDVKAASTQQLVKQTAASPALGPQRDNLLSGSCGLVGPTPEGSYALISLKGEGYAPDLLTDAIARCLALEQRPDGSYTSFDTRPPLSSESSIPNTALAARAMRLYAPPALARDLEAKVARARAYLISAKPAVGDDYAYRLLGLSWSEAKEDQIQAAARDLMTKQRPDGGWAQTPDLSSDAYETGLSLWALVMSDPSSVDGAAYRRGVDYLMRTQEADGSWHVRSRAFGFQPYFESGFPHGHDQWISIAATAWSAMALMPAAEQAQVRAAR